LEVVLCGKIGLGINLNSFVGSNKEEEGGLMSYSCSMPKALSKQVHVLGGVYNLVHQALARLYFQFAEDLLALEEIISSLQKVKGEAQKEFEKVDGQTEYYLMFTSSR
jgi:hypothetical protein